MTPSVAAARRRLSVRPGRAFAVYAMCLIGSTFILLPIVWMFSTALKTGAEVVEFPPALIPRNPDVGNFETATTVIPFWRYAFNSLLVAGLGAIGTVLSSAAAAFALTRPNLRGQRLLFGIVLATLILPTQVLLISQFLIFTGLGWYGTYLPLIVPSWLGGGAFNIFLLRQFLLTIPKQQEQAAQVDGAGTWRIFRRVILPQAVPALVAVGLLDFVSKWNDFLGPLIYLRDTDTYTLPLGLSAFRDLYSTSWNFLMADSLLAVLPCVALFVVAQRNLSKALPARS